MTVTLLLAPAMIRLRGWIVSPVSLGGGDVNQLDRLLDGHARGTWTKRAVEKNAWFKAAKALLVASRATAQMLFDQR